MSNPTMFKDPSGHAACLDSACNWIVHPGTGDIIWVGPGEPPVFGDSCSPWGCKEDLVPLPPPLKTPTCPLDRTPTDEEIYVLARMSWNETKGGGAPSMSVTSWVAVNRVGHPGFSNNGSLISIIESPGQFQGYPGTDPELVEYAPSKELWAVAQQVASDILNGRIPDPTYDAEFGGAIFFGHGKSTKDRLIKFESWDTNFRYGKVSSYNLYYWWYQPREPTCTPTPIP